MTSERNVPGRWIVGLCFLAAIAPAPATAAEPGWSGPIIARGATREQIEATPILERSNRPFHVYGNTVRRRYYRGRSAPAPRDFVQGGAALIRRDDSPQ